ncbi:MAG: amidohydrolase [Thermoanaerobaculia bacterium]
MNRFGLLLVLVCAACATVPPQQSADLLLSGGRVFTGDAARPWAEAIAIRGEAIAAVGSDDELRSLAGPSTRVVDLRGRLVVPGINDAHVHAPWPQEKVKFVPAPREGATNETILAALREAAAGTPEGVTLTSELPLALVDAGLTRDDLDAVSTAHRIRVGVFGGHSAILNTTALRDWNIAEEADDPPGGWYGRRDGRLNGWLYEHAYWVPQIRFAATATDKELRNAVLAFEKEAVGYGITSVQTMPIVRPERLEGILASLSPRLRWRIIDFRMAPFDGSPGRFPVKYVLDGTPIERSAATIEPYVDDPSTRGQINYRPEDIEAMVRDAARGERQLLVHAVGDRTVAALLDAMDRTAADWPALRVRIEHGDMITPELVERARGLGVVLVQNPAHFTIHETMNARFGSARASQSQSARSLLEKGNRFALGSDGPLNPFLNMFFAAIHPTNASETLTVDQSVRAYTAGAAWAELAETRKGRIAPGMLADLAVLSQDIFAVPPDALPKTSSVMTIVGGKVVWEAEGAAQTAPE